MVWGSGSGYLGLQVISLLALSSFSLHSILLCAWHSVVLDKYLLIDSHEFQLDSSPNPPPQKSTTVTGQRFGNFRRTGENLHGTEIVDLGKAGSPPTLLSLPASPISPPFLPSPLGAQGYKNADGGSV